MKKAFYLCVVLSVGLVLLGCRSPFRSFDNPVDPESEDYIGTPSEDSDGDGIAQYEDVDEIILLSPENGTVISELPVVLCTYRFNPEKIQQYLIQVSTDSGDFESNIVYENILPSNECEITLNNFVNGVYYWRAKAYDGAKWSDAWSELRSITLQFEISTVENPSPSDGSYVSDATPLLDWGDISEAVVYHLQVNNSTDFSGAVLIDKENLTNSDYPVSSALSNDNVYYWRVRIKNEDDMWGDWSSIWTFTVIAPPPTNPSPSDGAATGDITPLLDWEDISGAIGYQIQVNEAQDFSGFMIADDNTLGYSEYSVSMKLSFNTDYYWRVKTKNEDGWGDWGNTWIYSVVVNPIVHTIPYSYQIHEVYGEDLDGDGDMDLLCAADDEITWWENDGSENFTKHVITYEYNSFFSVHGEDLDGDGDLDVLGAADWGNFYAWWENDGSENFTKHSIIEGLYGAASVYAEDMDGDGDIDVFGCTSHNDDIYWWENDGSENFTIQGIGAFRFDGANLVCAVDLDGDGDMDVLGAAKYADEIAWWENDGSENFTKHTIADDYDSPSSMYVEDVDGDGDMDVLGTANSGDSINWWENDGNKNFTEHTIAGDFDGADSVYAVDVDGDGDMDVLGAAQFAASIVWWENDGSENFTAYIIASSYNSAGSVYAVDVDGDGDMDVLGASRSSGLIWCEIYY